MDRQAAPATPDQASRKRELSVFLFLTVVLAPLMSAAIVGAMGLGIWIWQMINGPPGS
jgi:nitrate reductase NapE